MSHKYDDSFRVLAYNRFIMDIAVIIFSLVTILGIIIAFLPNEHSVCRDAGGTYVEGDYCIIDSTICVIDMSKHSVICP